MELRPIEPPRRFDGGDVELSHVLDLVLEPDEIATLKTPSGSEMDVARKSWGYYATPSLNARLRESGLRGALVVGQPRAADEAPRLYLMAVEEGHEDAFDTYLASERARVVAWLDSDDAIAEAVRKLDSEPDN